MKRAKIQVTQALLTQALGFEWNYRIVYAHVSHDIYSRDHLELIIEGESLPDDFTVKEGQQIKKGHIILHTKHIDTEIQPCE